VVHAIDLETVRTLDKEGFMPGKVAIVEVAQLSGQESGELYVEQVYRVCKEVLDKAGLTRNDIGTVVSAASDAFHGGVSCANAYFWDSGAALLKNGSRSDGESLTAFYYGAMRVASGLYDTALVFGVCKGSENPETDMLTHFFTDPFYQRQIGLNETMAAGLQMREYQNRHGITAEQCAAVVVKNLGNALRNPYAHVKKRVTAAEVLNSEPVWEPLKALEIAPKSDGIVAMLLASEDRARKITEKPVWLKGFSSALDSSYLGDRDLLRGKLPVVAKRAYDMAGISDPRKELDVVELTEPYAFQELMWCEDLGLCSEGEGGRLIESGATQMDGTIPVNPSGGVLAMNPYVSRGLYRLAEVVLQIKGQAGEHQLDRKVNVGLAHGTLGFAGQSHAVAIVGN
jgi:acetyl-CoA C-acetyltransferase